MNSKSIIPREQARRDIEDSTAYYQSEGSAQAAVGFINAVERAFTDICRHPAIDSPSYAHELNLPGLRSLQLTRYPHVIFYVEREDHIDVWRVLHGGRDIPALMQEPDDI